MLWSLTNICKGEVLSRFCSCNSKDGTTELDRSINFTSSTFFARAMLFELIKKFPPKAITVIKETIARRLGLP